MATRNQDPTEKASLLSQLTFWWLTPLLKEGCKRPLEKEDLFETRKQDRSSMLGDLVGSNWEEEIKLSKEKGRKPNYIRALIRSFGLYYFLFGLFAFLEECIFRICTPVFLGYYIRYFNGVPGYTATDGYLWAMGIVLANVAILISHHPFFYGVQLSGMRIRIASCSLIYRKALRLSTKALGQTTIGQLVNLLSNDVNRFDTSVIFLHYIWIGPLQTIISIIILWREIGPSCLAGLVPLVLYVPLQSYMGRMFSKLRLITAIRTDERVRIMNEMASAIRVIKMYAWEKPFRKVVEEARRLEIDVIMKANYYRAVNLTLFFTSSKIILFIAFLVYVLTGNILTAEKVFITTALINNIRLTMTLFFSFGIGMGSESMISCKRIQRFLEMEEREECQRVNTSQLRPKLQHCYADGYNIYARWDSRNSEDNLKNVSFSVKAGEIMAIIGPVGSGKSSLLLAILTELPIKEGQINIRGRVSYASQKPWLFNGTVKDNILFGQPFSAKKYDEVIKVCALERDIELFPQGDLTHVGDRGVSLSGGQKARINLARAVYFDADIYLLDDPLSAVDAQVGNHLFEECIMKYLSGKAVILATHQLQFLSKTSHILLLNSKGSIECEGTHNQLQNKGIDFAGIILGGDEDVNANFSASEDKEDQIQSSRRLRRASGAYSLLQELEEEFGEDAFDKQSVIATSVMGGSVVSIENDIYFDANLESSGKKEVGAELKSQGSVGFKIYSKYFLTGGGVIGTIVFIISNIIIQVLYSGSDYWLSYWTNAEQLNGQYLLSNNGTIEESEEGNPSSMGRIPEFTHEDRLHYVNIYTEITVALLVLSLLRTVHLFKICMKASKKLHNNMFAAVVNVPIVFFETRPIGQILNRFTKDIGQVDDLLPPAMYDFISIALTFLGIMVLVLYLNIWLLIPTVFLGIVFVLARWVYICSSRDIKRLEGITRSPVFSHLSTTFQGLSTIRAFQAQGSSSDHFDSHQDLHTSCWYLFIATSRLFGIWLDSLSLILISFVTFSFMFQEGVLGGDVGLGLTMVMLLSGMLQWGVRQSAEVENHMTSVERILEYSKLEPEIPKDALLHPKKEGWPDQGQLTFENVYLYYDNNDPPVLKNLNFTIQPTEKIGIVGRTGAGKSSLLSCLFRLTPPQGEILIDGVRADSILLEDLRRSISIIPQDPTLFTGTVRYNLDPFAEYSDEQIWNALEEVQLKDHVKEMNGALEAQISEGGTNLSVGQRQLVCLARAILKHNKILVMDEATANVDPQTDSWIQETIRQKFTNCTVLTIAHRLHTIMDSDRVMVMDSGSLKEFETPYKLLQSPSSIFTDLVNQTGPVTAEQLRKIAEENYVAKTGGILPPRTSYTTDTLETSQPADGEKICPAQQVDGKQTCRSQQVDEEQTSPAQQIYGGQTCSAQQVDGKHTCSTEQMDGEQVCSAQQMDGEHTCGEQQVDGEETCNTKQVFENEKNTTHHIDEEKAYVMQHMSKEKPYPTQQVDGEKPCPAQQIDEAKSHPGQQLDGEKTFPVQQVDRDETSTVQVNEKKIYPMQLVDGEKGLALQGHENQPNIVQQMDKKTIYPVQQGNEAKLDPVQQMDEERTCSAKQLDKGRLSQQKDGEETCTVQQLDEEKTSSMQQMDGEKGPVQQLYEAAASTVQVDKEKTYPIQQVNEEKLYPAQQLDRKGSCSAKIDDEKASPAKQIDEETYSSQPADEERTSPGQDVDESETSVQRGNICATCPAQQADEEKTSLAQQVSEGDTFPETLVQQVGQETYPACLTGGEEENECTRL